MWNGTTQNITYQRIHIILWHVFASWNLCQTATSGNIILWNERSKCIAIFVLKENCLTIYMNTVTATIRTYGCRILFLSKCIQIICIGFKHNKVKGNQIFHLSLLPRLVFPIFMKNMKCLLLFDLNFTYYDE